MILEFFSAQPWFFETNIGLQSPGSLSGPVVASIRQRASRTSNFGGLEFFSRILSFFCDSWVFFVESWDFFSPMATNGRYYEKHLFWTLGNLIRISYTKYPTSTHHEHVVFGFMAFLCILWGWVFPSVIVCFSQSQGKKLLGGQKIASKKTVDSD